MSTINIITLIAIILFARLGVRLYGKYRKLKKEEQAEKEEKKKDQDELAP
jgi:cell division protein FtsL